MLNDIQYGLRQLIKNPVFTLVAVITLALGTGANTAIFSVVNAVLLKPLPFPAPDQIVAVGQIDTREQGPSPSLDSMCYPDFFDFRNQNQTFSSLAVYRNQAFALAGEQEAQSVRGEKVSAEFFDVLGIKPILGRSFSRPDEQPGGGPGGLKAILGYDLWKNNFNSDPAVLGRVLTLDGRPYTVIGVMPAGLQFPIQADGPELYVTIAEDASTVDGTKPVTEKELGGSNRA